MKIKICIVFFLFGIFSVSSLNKTDYKNLTDHDRILLGISYYEVALKYKELGKEDLYDSYMSEAVRIEKNVKKYADGVLEIPDKTININMDNIFPDEKDNSDNSDDKTSMNIDSSFDKKKI